MEPHSYGPASVAASQNGSPPPDPAPLRICRKCRRPAAPERFSWKRRARQERQSWCVECQRTYHREWYSKNRQTVIARVRRNDKRLKARLAQLKWQYLEAHPCIDCGESDPVVLEFDHIGGKDAEVSALCRRGVSWRRVLQEIARCEVRCANCHRRRTIARLESLGRADGFQRSLSLSSSRLRSRKDGAPHRPRRPASACHADTTSERYRCTRCGETKPAGDFGRKAGRARPVQDWCRACFAAYRVAYYIANGETERARVQGVGQRLARQWRTHRQEYLRLHPCVDCGEADPIILEFDHQREKLGDVARYARKRRTTLIEREIQKCEVRCANCHRRRTARQRAYYRWRG